MAGNTGNPHPRRVTMCCVSSHLVLKLCIVFTALEIQYHIICDELVDKYVVRTGFNCSFKACVFQHIVVVCNHFFHCVCVHTTPCLKKLCQCYFLNNSVKCWPILFFACNIAKKRDVNDYSLAHLTLILLLHYLVKCRSCGVAVYNNIFILGSTYIGSNMGKNQW